MRRFRTPAFYVGRNASLVLRLRRAVVSGRRPEQQTRGQLWSGVQGRSPWGESPQAFDYTRKLVTCPGLRAAAQHRILWLRLRRAVASHSLAPIRLITMSSWTNASAASVASRTMYSREQSRRELSVR